MNRLHNSKYLKLIFIILICMISLAGCSDNTPSEHPASELPADAPVQSSSSMERITPDNKASNSNELSSAVAESSASVGETGSVPITDDRTVEASNSGESSSTTEDSKVFAANTARNNSANLSAPQSEEESSQTADASIPALNLVIGDKSFTVILYDNASAHALLAKTPFTVNMDELNGNEKYYYMPVSLPTDSGKAGNINTGDLMLYGSDCLVLFYESFSTSYSYTKLGYIEDASGLAKTLGSGSVKVTFRVDGQ